MMEHPVETDVSATLYQQKERVVPVGPLNAKDIVKGVYASFVEFANRIYS